MNLDIRQARYKAIEEYRHRPLLVYATSTRQGVSSQIASDAVREFIDQIEAIPSVETKVDVLIHSTGGDALAAWKLMSVLRERFESVAVLVPNTAFSAATIFCLGANEIIMHPHASLGPIDPQISMRQADGTTRGFAFEDVGAFLRFVKDEIGITEQAYTSSIVDKLFAVVDPVNVGYAKRASELSTDVGERLLRMHMTGAEERGRARNIAENLNKSFFAHGDAVSRSRAIELQLRIASSDPDLETLLWNAYLGLESYMSLRTPFVPLEYFLTNGGAAALTPPAPIVLPPNAPQNLMNQIWSQVAQNALQQSMSNPSIAVPYKFINAVCESTRLASEHITGGTVSAAGMIGGDIRLSIINKESGWRQNSILTS